METSTGFKAAVFDIETSDLAAIGAGVLLCAVIRPIGGKSKVLRADEMGCTFGHEKRLVGAVLEELGKYRLWVGHNIIRFDWPWLKSRAKYFDLPYPRGAFAYDTMQGFGRLGYRSVMNHFGKPSKSLGHVVDFFGYPQEKTGIFPRQHWSIIWGNKDERVRTMNLLVDHCVKDVNMTEEIFEALIDDDYGASLRRLS